MTNSFASLDSFHDFTSDNQFNVIRFSVTNSRSLSPKFNSLVKNFDELDLDLMTISETWLKVGDKKFRQKCADEDLSIISRPRSTRGGGVAIVFKTSKVELKEAFAYPARFEAVCATGKWIAGNRKIVVVSAYLPPRMDTSAVNDFVAETKTRLEKMYRDLGDHLLIFGGDMNRKDIGQAFSDFAKVKQLIDRPTRGDAILDQCYTNMTDTFVSVLPPLYDDNGIDSDHAVCLVLARERKRHLFEKRTFWARQYSKEGEERFGLLLANHDWTALKNKPPDEAVELLTATLDDWHNSCFPKRKHVIRSCDKPWVTKRIRRLIRRKKRAFRKGGKTEVYRIKAERAETETKMNRIRFLDKVKKDMLTNNNVRGYYRAMKLLETDDCPPQWSVHKMFPGLSEDSIAEKAAEFFNAISNEFREVDPPVPDEDFGALAPSADDIRRRILKMKKPKGLVKGDIDHRLLNRYAALLSVPLATIFKQVFSTLQWPSIWKNETVTLLPKNKSPSGLAQLRNISCTPFFSKLLETFILDGLKSTISLAGSQFGGKKGQGIDHMLIETWDEIQKGLEHGSTAVNIMAVDFEKAFNRMDHSKCLLALEQLGGKKAYISLVNAFLSGRRMSVKVGESVSTPRLVSGGAPQGCILGGFLFCATIDSLLNITPNMTETRDDLTSTDSSLEISPIRAPLNASLGSGDSSDSEVNNFFRWFAPRQINDTLESQGLNSTQARDLLDVDEINLTTTVKGYIDDFNVIEIMDERLKVTHHTTNRTTSTIRADKCEKIFSALDRESSDLGMKINPIKTQVLCISAAAATDTSSYIRFQGEKIKSTSELKILGFWFDNTPTVRLHVEKMLAKARSRLCSLRKLRRSGLPEKDLLTCYTTYIRPILDYAAPTYHPQLTAEQSAEIERFQAAAMKLVFGPLVAYQTVIDHDKIGLHELRRKKLFENFANKSLANPCFKEKWFPLNNEIDFNLRKRNRFLEQHARTERYRKSPIQAMRRYLNRS